MTIVSDIRERGYAAVSEWAVKLDGAEPARAEPQAEGLPVDALLALADRVRRWHAVQRPADVDARGRAGRAARAALGAARHGRRLRPARACSRRS